MLLVPSQQTSKALYAGNSLFVNNVTGSDDTGQRGRADYPFYSLYAANKASFWGDSINVAFGSGYYSESVEVACMAGRFYNPDPGTLFADPTLNGAYALLPEVAGIAGNANITCIPRPFSSADVGREIVITWAGYDAQRYLIVSVAATVATLSDAAQGSGGPTTGTAYLVPGPMQTDPFMNGQTDGLYQFQRFSDSSTLVLAGPSITATTVKYLADGATLFAPNQQVNADTAHPPTLVSSSYAETGATTPSGLLASFSSLSGLNPLGRCTMVVTAKTPSGLISGTNYICGENDSSSILCAIEQTSGSPSTNLKWGAGGTAALPTGSWFAAALAQNDSSNGYWWLVSGGVRTNGSASGANTGAFSLNNYAVGGATTGASQLVGGYAFFDGPSSTAKLNAMLNAFLNDLGLY